MSKSESSGGASTEPRNPETDDSAPSASEHVIPNACIARLQGGYVLIEFELVIHENGQTEVRSLKVGNAGPRWIVEGQLERARRKINHWVSNGTHQKRSA